MAAPFSQTIRSLKADQSYGKSVTLALFSLLLAGWLVWAFAARIPSRLTSETDQIQLAEVITTIFGKEAAAHLTPGLSALVILDAPPLTEPLVLPAQVLDVYSVEDKTEVQIVPDFSLLEADTASPEILAAFSQPTSGRVEVEIERVSPAFLVLRAAGLTAETAPVVTSR